MFRSLRQRINLPVIDPLTRDETPDATARAALVPTLAPEEPSEPHGLLCSTTRKSGRPLVPARHGPERQSQSPHVPPRHRRMSNAAHEVLAGACRFLSRAAGDHDRREVARQDILGRWHWLGIGARGTRHRSSDRNPKVGTWLDVRRAGVVSRSG